MHLAALGVDDDGIALSTSSMHAARLADGGDAERPRHDGDMALRRRLLQHQAAQARAVVVEQLGGAHGAGDEDGVVRQIGPVAAVRAAARQDAQQAVGEIVEIVQPLAQYGIGLAQHARAGVVLHALDRRLGGQAAL